MGKDKENMRWIRLSWIIIFILAVVTIWELFELRTAYQKLALARSKYDDGSTASLLDVQRDVSSQKEYLESMEKIATWSKDSDPVSWLSQQAVNTGTTVVGLDSFSKERDSDYEKIRFIIRVRGSYNALGRFINKLEHSPNAVKIESMRIKYNTSEQLTLDVLMAYFRKAKQYEDIH